MEVIPRTGREDETDQKPFLSLGIACVPWRSKKRIVPHKWGHTLLQQLLLKKLLRTTVLPERDDTKQSRVHQQ